MKRFILSLVVLGISGNAFAECNLATDVVGKGDKVEYTLDCHKLVGKTFMDNEDRKKKISLQEEMIAYQKEQLAITAERADVWKQTSLSMQKDVDSIRTASEYKGYIAFGAGILTTVLAGYALKQASK